MKSAINYTIIIGIVIIALNSFGTFTGQAVNHANSERTLLLQSL